MQEFDLEFCFKVNRKYVQGPDIFDTAIKNISKEYDEIKAIKYTAYAMLYKNATMYITNKVVKSDYSIINSLISFIQGDMKFYAVISENNKLIECSSIYSEEIVENNSKITDNMISFKNILSDSYTEIVVSMNKYFFNQTIKLEGKWIVTKFDYFELTDIVNIKNKDIALKLLQNFNNKLTKSLLLLDDKPVGYLYFSLIPKES